MISKCNCNREKVQSLLERDIPVTHKVYGRHLRVAYNKIFLLLTHKWWASVIVLTRWYKVYLRGRYQSLLSCMQNTCELQRGTYQSLRGTQRHSLVFVKLGLSGAVLVIQSPLLISLTHFKTGHWEIGPLGSLVIFETCFISVWPA